MEEKNNTIYRDGDILITDKDFVLFTFMSYSGNTEDRQGQVATCRAMI